MFEIPKIKIDITYQDVDVAGVVYFANYFNYAEKARSIFIKDLFGSIRLNDIQHWAVKSTSAEYLFPAKLDDIIIVDTKIEHLKMASFTFIQNFWVKDKLLCVMKTHILSINNEGKPIRIDKDYFEKISKFVKGD